MRWSRSSAQVSEVVEAANPRPDARQNTPWRELVRCRQKRRLFGALVCSLGTGVILAVAKRAANPLRMPKITRACLGTKACIAVARREKKSEGSPDAVPRTLLRRARS